MSRIEFVILGEPASKSNSRSIVRFGDRMAVIKSQKARDYEKRAVLQIPSYAKQRIEGPVRVTLHVYYGSERPDLDESVVLDVMQDRYKGTGSSRVLVRPGVYRNDRQVRAKLVIWALDRQNPRTEILVEPITAQQAPLAFPVDTGGAT